MPALLARITSSLNLRNPNPESLLATIRNAKAAELVIPPEQARIGNVRFLVEEARKAQYLDLPRARAIA
jgi:hypothetical protein